jgi:hypothetical protein
MKKIMFVIAILFVFVNMASAESKQAKEIKREEELKELQKRFEWWPTDAKPGPVKDPERGGYWWWPTEPGKAHPLGESWVCVCI